MCVWDLGYSGLGDFCVCGGFISWCLCPARILQSKALILLQRHSQSEEYLCFLTLVSCKTMVLLSLKEFWYICRILAISGINVNSAVNRLTLCTALQRTEINTILWKLWEEASFNCIFGHRVSLSQVQILACLRAEGTLGHATAWRSWWVHLYLELISCDAAEWLTLNTELLRFWWWFFSLSLLLLQKKKVSHLIEGWWEGMKWREEREITI